MPKRVREDPAVESRLESYRWSDELLRYSEKDELSIGKFILKENRSLLAQNGRLLQRINTLSTILGREF